MNKVPPRPIDQMAPAWRELLNEADLEVYSLPEVNAPCHRCPRSAVEGHASCAYCVLYLRAKGRRQAGMTTARPIRQCRGCGFEFSPRHGRQLYCNPKCLKRQTTECTQHSLRPEERFAILQGQDFRCGCCHRKVLSDQDFVTLQW